jgi:poly(3-hydroxybutyrate) depolymerase
MLAPLPSSEAFALRSAMLCGLIHSAAVLTPSAGCTAAAATGTAGAVPPSPPGVAGAHKIHVAEPSSPTGTQSRHFRLRTPASYDPEGTQQQPLPLVMDIHGYTSTSYKQMRNSGFLNISDEMNFIGLWPDGSGDCLSDDPSCEHSWDSCSACNQGWNCLGTTSAQAGPLGPTCNPDRRAWGRYSCYASCGDSCEPRAADNTTDTCISSSCWDDIGFVSEMLDWVEQRLCVDLDHVHVRPLHCRFFTVGQAAHRRCVQVSGLSNGAMMTYYIAHRLSARIASIAPVAGLPLLGYLKQAVPTAPMAVMATNGLLDHVIPANISNGFMGRAGVQRARAGRVTASTVRPARLPDLEKRLARPSAFSIVETTPLADTPLDNVTAAIGEANQCSGSGGGGVLPYPTPKDGDLLWRCVLPEGDCSETGATIVRCSSLAEHIWPTFTDVECEADTCLEDDMHCPFAEWARLAWAFFENHPRLPQQSAAHD